MVLETLSTIKSDMLTPKASRHVFIPKRLCFAILALVFMFRIPHYSSARIISPWFNSTKDSSQYLQFAQPAIPSLPSGSGFASGSIDLGGLRVYQAQYFTKIWTINEGGYDNLGTSFYEPASYPEGYYLLGHFSRPNSKPIYASVLVAQDTTGDSNSPALAKPMAYALMWSSEGVSISKDGEGYIWLPIPPNGYKPVGQIVTTSSDMPSVDLVRVVREDLTSELEVDQWVWGNDQFNVQTMKPTQRGVDSLSVPVGTFMGLDGPVPSSAIAGLKRAQLNKSSMPNNYQVRALLGAYGPMVYFHPEEEYLPSTVNWFFVNGALLYKTGQTEGTPINAHGWNLPYNGSVDDSNLDLPIDETARDQAKRGHLQGAKAYVHVKPAFGATHTDLTLWLYYPFNGPGRFQFGPLTIKFNKLGEHVSDWEHLVLRVDNFNGGLKCIYLSQHNKGSWINAMEFDYESGKPVVYSSLNGHAMYASEGQIMHGQRVIPATDDLHFQEKDFAIGARDDTGKGNKMDIHGHYELLESDANISMSQKWLSYYVQLWMNYPGRWGPKIKYNTEEEINLATEFLPAKIRDGVRKVLSNLPGEVFGEEGPQGPMMKDSWAGDERV